SSLVESRNHERCCSLERDCRRVCSTNIHHQQPEEAARALHACLEKFNTVRTCVRSHIPVVQTHLGRLFPYGLQASDIVSNPEKAKEAADAIRSEISRHRLEGAKAALNATLEKLSTYNGCICQEIADFLLRSVGDPDVSWNKIGDAWASHL